MKSVLHDQEFFEIVIERRSQINQSKHTKGGTKSIGF